MRCTCDTGTNGRFWLQDGRFGARLIVVGAAQNRRERITWLASPKVFDEQRYENIVLKYNNSKSSSNRVAAAEVLLSSTILQSSTILHCGWRSCASGAHFLIFDECVESFGITHSHHAQATQFAIHLVDNRLATVRRMVFKQYCWFDVSLTVSARLLNNSTTARFQ